MSKTFDVRLDNAVLVTATDQAAAEEVVKVLKKVRDRLLEGKGANIRVVESRRLPAPRDLPREEETLGLFSDPEDETEED